MPGVEFLPARDDPGDQPHEQPPRPARRLRWLLAGAVLVAGAVTWAVLRSGGQAPVAAPRPLPTRTGPIATAAPSALDGQACHGAPFCQTSVAVPHSVIRAVAAHLPAPYSVRVQSHVAQSLTTGGSYLADRDIEVSGPRLRVLIVVHRRYATTSASPIAPIPAGSRSTLVHVTTAAYDVDMQCLAAAADLPPRTVLRALARDARLETP